MLRRITLLLLAFVPCAPAETRQKWENTRLTGSPDGPSKYRAVRAWPGLKAGQMIAAEPEPGGKRLFFLEQKQGIPHPPMILRAFREPADVETLLEFPFLAYTIAFHPRYSENGFVFFGVNEPDESGRRHSTVLRYTVVEGRLDVASRKVIIKWPSDGHNGAAIAFAGDGILFVTSGDGTSDSDTDLAGQDTRSLLAKVLRINVDKPSDTAAAYSVPPDNPFIGNPKFAPETWAYGLRNPWRLTFDKKSSQLWVGENGQDHWEYARLVQRGANFGWSRYEGSHPFILERAAGPDPVTFPTIEHSHEEFRSLSGGVVYRGKKFPELAGAYIYGDFRTGRIWAAKHDGSKLEWHKELADTPLAITSIGADADGELLFTDYGTSTGGVAGGGAFYRLEPAPAVNAPPFPTKLSDTGLFADTAKQVPAPGVLPYSIAFPAWHDGAKSDRWLALPGDGKIEITTRKSWIPPDGTALAQTLILDGRRIETRILVKQQDDWAAYTYTWNPAQTDAELAAKGGTDITIARPDFRQPWRVPSRAECHMCHSREAGFAIALTEPQLNVPGQFARLEGMGILKRPVPTDPLKEPPKPFDQMFKFQSDTPENRARAYLAANCAHCHTNCGGGNSAMEFDWMTPTKDTRIIDVIPQHATFGIANARIIAPGDLARSILPLRASHRGAGHMPPLGTLIPDPEAARILAEWVLSLK